MTFEMLESALAFALAVGLVLYFLSRVLTYCFGQPALGLRLLPCAFGLLGQAAALFVLVFLLHGFRGPDFRLGPHQTLLLAVGVNLTARLFAVAGEPSRRAVRS